MKHSEHSEQETGPLELVPSDSLGVIERAEIDVQIATAHRYPRSMAAFKRRALEMVTMDEETAQSCIYRRPVGKKWNPTTRKEEVEFAEGKSVRLAEIVGACYGNLRVASMIVDQTDRYVKARGVAHDLESNFASTSEVIEPTVTKEGKPFSERMRAVVAKAALAKAHRDATFKVVPGALCKTLEQSARETAIGTTATLGSRRSKVMDWVNKLGIEPVRVFAALGISGSDDIGLEQIETLTGIRTAIKDKEFTADEAFPPIKQDSKVVFVDTKKPEKPETPAAQPEPTPARKPTAAVESATANPWFVQVAEFLAAAGVEFDTFKQWLNAGGRARPEETANWAGWEDIPESLAKNLMESAAVVKCATIYGKK